MTDNKKVFQRLQGIGKNIPADSLNDVFHKLRTVTLNSAPFLSGIYAHIGDAVSTKLVNAHSWLNVGKFSAGRQGGTRKAPELSLLLVQNCRRLPMFARFAGSQTMQNCLSQY